MLLRGHVYALGFDLRCLPTCSLENTFQFLSCISRGATCGVNDVRTDSGFRVQVYVDAGAMPNKPSGFED